MDVIYFGQQAWDVCWVSKQHLLSRLAQRGHRVLYIDPLPTKGGAPGVVGTLRTLAAPLTSTGLRQEAPRLWVQTLDDSPWWPAIVNARRRPSVIRATMRRLGIAAPVCMSSYPHARWLIEQIPHHGLIYKGEDDWTQYGGITPDEARRLRQEEETLLTRCDVALAVSPRLLERFSRIQPHTYLQENAVDADFFSPASLDAAAPHPACASLPRPRLGFTGQVDDRLDPDLIERIATALPQASLVLTGRIAATAEESRLRALPNVYLTGYVPYDQLPSVARELDVLLVPYRQTQLTQSCNPLKVYEYLATGRPVVSTDLEGLGATREVIRVASTHDAFIAAVREALAHPEAGREARLAAAKANSWEDRTDLLESRMEEAKRRALERRGLRGTAAPAWPRSQRSPAVVLDAKEESERRLAEGWRNQRFNAMQRSFFEVSRIAGIGFWATRVLWRAMSPGETSRPPLEPRRILVVRHGHLGDMIAYLPSLVALRHRFPEAHIAVAVGRGSGVRGLLEAVREVDEVLTLDFMEHEQRLERLRGAWRLWRRGFDLMVCGIAPFLVREALFAGAPRRWTLWEGHPWQWLCNRRIPVEPMRHEAQNNLRLIAALGGPPRPDEQAPRLTLHEAAMARAERELDEELPLNAELDMGPDDELVAIHVGSKRPSRRWPEERFVQLTARLLADRPGVRVVFTGTPDESQLIDSIRNQLPPELRNRTVSAAGRTSLLSMVVLLGRCRLLICNDTGVMHVARALGRPLLALLGPENDLRWGPHPETPVGSNGDGHAGGGAAVGLRVLVPCAPCVKWECDEHYCLRSLGVDEVLAAAVDLLEGRRGEGLEMRRRRLDWAALHQAGFRVPLVSVVVLATPVTDRQGSPDGKHAATSSHPLADRVNATLAATRATGYPRLDIRVIAPSEAKAALEAAESSNVAIHLDGDAPATHQAAIHLALAESEGEYIVIYRAGDTSAADALKADVASLFRSPPAGWVQGEDLGRWAHEQSKPQLPPLGALTRREMLEAWAAAHPVPPKPDRVQSLSTSREPAH